MSSQYHGGYSYGPSSGYRDATSSGSSSSQSHSSRSRGRPFAASPSGITDPSQMSNWTKFTGAHTPETHIKSSTPTESHSSAYHVDSQPMMFNKEYMGPDDYIHDLEPRHRQKFGMRGCVNIGTLVIIALGLLMLFMGYPLLYHFAQTPDSKKGGFNLGGTNGSGQIPNLHMRTSLIDPDTPQEALTRTSFEGEEQVLVFSDEFNVDGRSFYPGDDPFWEAIDLWAHGTGDFEWYDPAAVTTEGGNMVITAIEHESHNLNFRSGHVSTWNKFCFTGGYIEVRAQMPGSSSIAGWWPAAWTMGNLGRANYGATTEGTWPYSYDACDVGTLPNQTYPDGSGPELALTSGDTVFNNKYGGTSLSWLPGQRLSSCTCPDDDHPGPKMPDGTWKARSAPEIDIIEAQVGGGKGHVSQSSQFAPFNAHYQLLNGTRANPTMEWYAETSELNSYQGNVLQQSASGVTETPQRAYQLSGGEFAAYGFEYRPGYKDSYITWVSGDERAWKLSEGALGADPRVNISARPVPQEPMYIILNLAISSGFGDIDWDNIRFPGKYLIDHVRVYQTKGQENVGCDPPDFPTKKYIEKHAEAYNNPNLTVWGDLKGGYGQPWPRNRMYQGACDRPAIYTNGPN
ncbi:unnamed protein product [Sympodiomycopsis kandeliae]